MKKCFPFFSVVISMVFAVVGCGNDISRSDAASKLEKVIAPIYIDGIDCQPNSRKCSGLARQVEERDLYRLEEMGLIKVKARSFGLFTGETLNFELMDSAIPYTVPRNRYGANIIAFIGGTIDSVEVNGISKPADSNGQKVCTATYSATYKATPFGEIFFRNNEKLFKSGNAIFVLYDDGWRIAEIN